MANVRREQSEPVDPRADLPIGNTELAWDRTLLAAPLVVLLGGAVFVVLLVVPA